MVAFVVVFDFGRTSQDASDINEKSTMTLSQSERVYSNRWLCCVCHIRTVRKRYSDIVSKQMHGFPRHSTLVA